MKLNPCKLCGSEAEIVFDESYDFDFIPRCTNTRCLLHNLSVRCDFEEEAAQVWNTGVRKIKYKELKEC